MEGQDPNIFVLLINSYISCLDLKYFTLRGYKITLTSIQIQRHKHEVIRVLLLLFAALPLSFQNKFPPHLWSSC